MSLLKSITLLLFIVIVVHADHVILHEQWINLKKS